MRIPLLSASLIKYPLEKLKFSKIEYSKINKNNERVQI